MAESFPSGADIDERLVRALVAEQFPAWAGRPVRAVAEAGNDHRTFRLGDDLLVRLPADTGYVPQVGKEQEWLPKLAPQLPLPIPAVAGVGRPSASFPAPWSVFEWLAGRRPDTHGIRDDVALAEALAAFLVALRRADAAGGPPPGPHSAYRGAAVTHYADEVEARFGMLDGADRDRALGLWRDAVSASFAGPPVWVHGDVAIANLLVDTDARLSAVIDFGCSAVGDPACDTVIRWTQFEGRARAAFVDGLDLDDATWARGAGWTLWKGLIMLTNVTPGEWEFARRVLGELLRPGR